MKPARFLTARSTVIGLFLAITASLLAANLLPQKTLEGKPPAWLRGLPDGARFLGSLGLDNIVGSPWFAGLILVFCLSLLLSTVSQFGSTRAQFNRTPQPGAPGSWIRVPGTLEGFTARLAAAGYRPAGSGAGVQRFVKHRIGYWGNFLLHLGLVTAVLFSLVYVLTQHRVLVRLVGQEVTRLTPETVVVKRGLLPVQSRLPASVTLVRLEPRFWGNDKLESLASELYFTDHPGDQPRRVDVALSDKSSFGPFLVYQGNPYGLVFDLELSTPGGEFRQERLLLPYPARRDAAGYGEVVLPDGELLLKGKFFADAGKNTIQARSPLLTLRLFKGSALQGEATLKPGERGQLGPWSVRLTRVEWWTDILLDGSRGISGIFAGFAILLAGVLSSYCLVPREITVRQEAGALLAQHYVRRFAQLYREEFAELVGATPKQGES